MLRSSKPLVVFGAATLAQTARHALRYDGGREIAAVTVDAAYVRSEFCDGLPLVAFESLPDRFPPEAFELVLPLGFHDMNGLRQTRCQQALAMGYTLSSFVSRRANVAAGVEISANVLVYEQAVVQPFVRLGWNVTLRTGAILGHHSVVGDHCFVASAAVTGGNVTLGERCWIGLGAVIRDNLRLAERTFVGAGAVVVADTESDGVYVGNPARKMSHRTAQEVTSRLHAPLSE